MCTCKVICCGSPSVYVDGKMENVNKSIRNATESSILYELLFYSEWKQEPELPKILPARQEGFVSLLKSIFRLPRENDVQFSTIERLLNWLQPWRLAVGDGGKVIAIIQDSALEIRSSRDEFSSIIGKAGLPKDLYPQWRRWCWSPDCSMLALGFSNGSIRAYDLMGSNLFTISAATSQIEQVSADTCNAFSACFFVQARASTRKWSSELVTVNYRGELRNFLVSPTEGFQESHSFSFSQYYRLGITAVAYHPMHSILFVAGPTGTRSDPTTQDHGSGIGLTAWRILNDYPFYKLILNDKKNDSGFLSDSIWNQLPSLRYKPQQSIVVRMELSPSAKHLAALHSCGGVSIWSVPGLRKLAFWQLQDQPGWNIQNPSNTEVTALCSDKKSQTLVSIENFYPIDLDWWSDEALVLSRNSGAVSVCEISTLTNLLGESPEFMAGSAQIRRFHNGKGFLALECESETLSKNRDSGMAPEEEILSVSNERDDCENDEMPVTLMNHISALLTAAAYLVTDLERFRPKRKRLRLFRRTYRLLALRSTTPEELFSRKLDNEEYGEALTLAHTYNLDCDLVYQRQWRNSKVSVASIRDFLSKVSKQMWVLQECVERVPESLLAARELLEFGLKATSKDVFRSLGCKRKVKDVSDMTSEQCQVLVFRRTLLNYQDRLTTYEKILGGAQLADELFEFATYAEFRSASSLKATVLFARAANCQAVECMLTYHGSKTRQHWLPVLSNIPETICPNEYRSLLPECSLEGVLFPLKESCLRDLDWSEKDPYCSINNDKLQTPAEDNECLYQYEPSLSAYRGPVGTLTPALVQQWYCERIRSIERSSRMVDNALTLLYLAQDRNVEGLESLEQELKTLDALVYELYLEDVSLEDLEKKSAVEKCRLLMSKTSKDTFVSDLNKLLFPFLSCSEKESPGTRLELLLHYLVGLACEDLSLPQKFFDQCQLCENFGGVTHAEQISLAQACLYSYLGTDQFHMAQHILACIPRSRESLALQDSIHTLENELAACLILQRNNTAKTLGYIRDNKDDPHTVMQLLTRMARTVADSTQTPSEIIWTSLLKDILDLQQSVFVCVPISSCYEVFCLTLLSSGDLYSINLCSKYLSSNLKPNDPSLLQGSTCVSLDKARSLLLTAAREYMDSSGSLTDPALELALACLHLIQNKDDEIEVEINLISSFQLLHEFGITKLPLQVRLCSDRLQLIDECLKKKSGAHRHINRLLKLAASLNICGSDFRQRQGRVLVLVAESAFSVNDFRCCGEICQRILTCGYAAGWQVVSQLGRCSRFSDLSLRTQLLAFALQHSPSEFLKELIEARCSLEVDSLHQEVNKLLLMHNVTLSAQLEEPIPSVAADSIGGDFLQTLQIGEMAVRETTRRLLSHVGDTSFWKKAFHIGCDAEDEKDSSHSSVSSSHFVFHAFYLSLFESVPCVASILGPRYDSFATPDVPPHIQLEQALLQISLLEQEKGSYEGSIANILIECAYSLLPEDNCLGLAYLLAVPGSLSIQAYDHVFGCELSTVKLKLAQYHAALLQYRNFVSGNSEKLHDIFLHDPNEVIEFVKQKASPSDSWAKVLGDWRSRLVHFQQDQDLLSLDCGIDVERFACDEQYRHDSILGLAMSDECNKLNFALNLASRYNIQRAEVIAEHIASLMLSSLPFAEIRNRLKEDKMLQLIKEASLEVQTKLVLSVLPMLSGNQMEYLQICYEILNQVAPGERFGRLLPKDHLKLLSKVQIASTDIDYKLLISGPKYTLKAVQASLTPDNIPLVAKLLKAIPPTLANNLTSSQLYGIFIQKQLEVCPSIAEDVDVLCSLVKNMKSSDILELVIKVYFVDNGSPVHLSEGLLKAGIINCQKTNDPDSLNLLKKWENHVQASKYLLQKWPENSHCRTFFYTRGEDDTLSSFAQKVLLDDEISIDFVLDLMNVSNVPSFEAIITESLKSIQDSLNEKETCNWEMFGTLLHRLEQFISSKGNINECNEEWEVLLRPMAALDVLPPALRLRVLQLLQSIKSEETEESTFLMLHTKAIIASAWPHIVLHISDIQEEEKRASLLLNLISCSESWLQRDALLRLLVLWPIFSDVSGSPYSEILFQMLLNCIKCNNGLWSDQKASFITEISRSYPITFSCVERILEDFQQDATTNSDDDDESLDEQVDVQLLMLMCLVCEDSRAHSKAVTLAQHRLMEPLQNKVAELAAARNLVVDLVSTPAYPDLLSFILSSTPEQADDIIKTLTLRKYIPEAGAVILRSVKPIPQFMRTFSASLIAGLGRKINTFSEDPKVQKVERPGNSPTPSECFVKSSSLVDNLESGVSSQKQNNDWDVSDEEWSNVEVGSLPKGKREMSSVIYSAGDQEKQPLEGSLVASSPPHELIDEANVTGPEIRARKDEGGWGDWSDEELDRLPQDTASGETSGRAFMPSTSNMPMSSTPSSFLPSSRSAFVRVPPRDQTKAETPSLHEEGTKVDVKTTPQEGWDSSSDDDWNW